ncbi:MAG: hydantoinase/oxoprolinase N-terminal domain-containing protein, partial [Alphaproteobacteria bacterium]
DMTGQVAANVTELPHGSTIAANALIQRRGAPMALITTAGFRDVLFIQRQDKSSVYDMFYQKPAPLIGRDAARRGGDRNPHRGDHSGLNHRIHCRLSLTRLRQPNS